MKKVLILGGGFAGIESAIELSKANTFEVTLVSYRNYLYLFPVSIWIPVHITEFEDVKIPITDIQKKHPFIFIKDRVTEIRAAANEVMPIIGHWLKKGWSSYARLTKLGKIPRFPGL